MASAAPLIPPPTYARIQQGTDVPYAQYPSSPLTYPASSSYVSYGPPQYAGSSVMPQLPPTTTTISTSVQSLPASAIPAYAPTALESGKAHVLYEDKSCILSTSGITIKHYYFPFGQSKNIRWEEVQSVELVDPGFMEKKYWGMGLSKVWWNMDYSRQPTREHPAVIIHLKHNTVYCGITPSKPFEVASIVQYYKRDI